MALIHGGQLQQVAKQYKIPPNDWLDLSTGIAPLSYPIPLIPLSAWQQLPQQSLTLIAAAKQYYQCQKVVITNGSQAIIKALPSLYQQQLSPQQSGTITVYLPTRGYKEHAQAWDTTGYTLHFYQESLPKLTTLTPHSVVVIINPNNPTGKLFSCDVIRDYHAKLTELNGLLVLDEAFIDVIAGEQSYCRDINDKHCIVLRSFGKFFGLAGIRIGFLIADNYWCTKFKAVLGPWQVNGPAQVIAEQALADKKWHHQQRHKLHELRVQQETLLWQVFTDKLVSEIQGSDLFLTVSFHQTDTAKNLYHLLCQQGVYCRLADEQDTLRFGITLAEDFVRLEQACAHAREQLSSSSF